MGQRNIDRTDERFTEAGLAAESSGSLLSLIGKIDEATVLDFDLEQFSRRWFATDNDDCLARESLEAALIANRLRRQNRRDLAAHAALCLLRAAWVQGHGIYPPRDRSIRGSEIGRALFRQYGVDVLARCARRSRPMHWKMPPILPRSRSGSATPTSRRRGFTIGARCGRKTVRHLG
jgi:hypothetical protein